MPSILTDAAAIVCYKITDEKVSVNSLACEKEERNLHAIMTKTV